MKQIHSSIYILYFDNNGILINDLADSETAINSTDISDISFNCKFKVGDIVSVKGFPKNNKSPCTLDIIGVIATQPISVDDEYTIYYICKSGYLDHNHFPEEAIEKYDQKLPDDLVFLNILSDYYLGKVQIDINVFKDICEAKYFLRKVKFFKEDDYK